MNVWSVLGMTASRDERAIKRAYAIRLKVTRPEDDPAAFQLLNDAYQAALHLARHANELDWPDDDTPPRAEEDEQPVYTAAYEFDPSDRDEAPIYTAAYEFDPSGREEAPVYTAAYEFDPSLARPEPQSEPQTQPERGPSSPVAEARRIWAAFLPGAHKDTRRQLERLFAGEELLNIELRECFEECAVQYCAGEGCDDAFREALAAHFGWADDASFVGRQMPDETGMMLARLRAQRSYAHFCALAGEDDVVRALLIGDVWDADNKRADASFTDRMRELIEHIRCHHGEMLELKLNRDSFERWETIVAAKGGPG